MSVLRLVLPFTFTLATLLVLCCPFAAVASPETTARARKFLQAHEAKLRPLEIKASEAWWDANTTGKDEDFKRKEESQNKIDAALADSKAFAEVKALQKAKDDIDDLILARAIEVLYLTYLEKQVEPVVLKRMVNKSN